ncbi:MAG: class I SAM-dependent methyltransferase [Defluviitaleaceae bacterium]|nr:class I SAM-dependent methyltransferase [Defluviitaleaceae bacterium]
MNTWTYHNPDFKSDLVNLEMLKYSPWAGHRNFAYDYVANMCPATIVELGTHYGTSFFAFLQAVEDGKSPKTQIYGIDAWGYIDGNEWTKKEYEIDIYNIFLKTLDIYKHKAKAHTIRKIFDDALADVEDNSVDLLHIDGNHTYDAVKHDYETWIPKVKESGVILFHDVSETSYLHENSSPEFWKEIKSKHQYTLEFDHCYGLGIFCKNSSVYHRLKQINLMHYQHINNLLDVQNRDDLRKNYFKLKDNDIYINFLKRQQQNIEDEIKKYEDTISKKDSYIHQLQNEHDTIEHSYAEATSTIANKDAYINQLCIQQNNMQKAYEKTIVDKDSYIDQLCIQQNNMQKAYEKTIVDKDAYIDTLHVLQDDIKTAYEKTIVDKDTYIENIKNEHQEAIAELQQQLKIAKQNTLRSTCQDEGQRNHIKNLEEKIQSLANRKRSLVSWRS